jgi:hypothetical protein
MRHAARQLPAKYSREYSPLARLGAAILQTLSDGSCMLIDFKQLTSIQLWLTYVIPAITHRVDGIQHRDYLP